MNLRFCSGRTTSYHIVLPRLLAPEGGALQGAGAVGSTAHQLLAVGKLPAEAVAVAWAQSCDGILVSDAGDC